MNNATLTPPPISQESWILILIAIVDVVGILVGFLSGGAIGRHGNGKRLGRNPYST
jgi:uncharacterized protein YneF (UPF0154 family)